MSFTTLTDTTTVNGKSSLEVFAKAPRTITRTTPVGRHVTTTLDSKGRVVKMEVEGVLPVDLAYDAHGRLETVTQGMRILTRGYGSGGFLESVTDPLGQLVIGGLLASYDEAEQGRLRWAGNTDLGFPVPPVPWSDR